MGIFDDFETKLESLFSRTFRDDVEPLEIARKLQQEMDTRAAIISLGKTVAPNRFTVEIGPAGWEKLSPYIDALQTEMTSTVRDYATEQRFSFLGEVAVLLAEDNTLDSSAIRVRSEVRPDARPEARRTPLNVGEPGVQARLIIGSTSYPLTKSRTRIGRGSAVDVSLDDPAVSRAHAEIILGSPTVIRDLGSANGTTVDGRPIAECPLYDRAKIQLGTTPIEFRSG